MLLRRRTFVAVALLVARGLLAAAIQVRPPPAGDTRPADPGAAARPVILRATAGQLEHARGTRDPGTGTVIPVPRERPKIAPATLSPASKALVSQAQAQRKKGDLPGASRLARPRAAYRTQQSAAVDRDGPAAHGPAQLPAGRFHGTQGAQRWRSATPHPVGRVAADRRLAAGPWQEPAGPGRAGKSSGTGTQWSLRLTCCCFDILLFPTSFNLPDFRVILTL